LRLDSDPAKVREMESQLTELSHSIIAVLSLALQVSKKARAFFFDLLHAVHRQPAVSQKTSHGALSMDSWAASLSWRTPVFMSSLI
jgi:hypothetical protein